MGGKTDTQSEMVRETYRFCPQCAARVEIGRVQLGDHLICVLCGCEFPVRRNAHHSNHLAEQKQGRAGE